MKRVSIFGLGYVGAVTAACLAHKEHKVIGVDVNPAKVEMLASGWAPVLEPGLDQLITDARGAGMLEATTDSQRAVSESEISFVCVGTPSLRNGRLDLSSVERSCDEVGKALRAKDGFHWIVLRSTVLPGTIRSFVIPALETASRKRAGVDFAVCANPEFTREGSAVADFLNPGITVLGADDSAHLVAICELYQGIAQHVFKTSLGVAEMVKYVCNAFHALKVSFANEIGALCQCLEIDERAVTEIFTSDTKLNISRAYLTPGFAFGGSCLPKDLRALTYCAKQLDVNLPLLRAIMPSNEAHLERAVEAVLATKGRKIGILGLSFKPGTDDLRESPSVELIKRLLGEGRQIRIWDGDVSLGRLVGSNRQFIAEAIPHIGRLLSADLEEVVRSAEVVVVGTKIDSEVQAKLDTLGPDQTVIDLNSCRPFNIAGRAYYGPASSLTSEVEAVVGAAVW